MKEEEIEKGDWGSPTRNFGFEKERKSDEEENERGGDRERRLRAANPKLIAAE